MNQAELRLKLEPFVEKCKEEGIEIAEIIMAEAFPGASNTSFFVDVLVPSVTAQNYIEVRDKAYEILWGTTEGKTRRSIHTFCIINEHREAKNYYPVE